MEYSILSPRFPVFDDLVMVPLCAHGLSVRVIRVKISNTGYVCIFVFRMEEFEKLAVLAVPLVLAV
jgi:hypothetical protein